MGLAVSVTTVPASYIRPGGFRVTVPAEGGLTEVVKVYRVEELKLAVMVLLLFMRVDAAFPLLVSPNPNPLQLLKI